VTASLLSAKRRPTRRALAAALLLSAFAAAPAAAQAPAAGTRVLTQDDYDSWRSIHSPALSPDGAWALYTLSPTVGDGEVVVRSTTGGAEHRAGRGATGRAQLQPSARGNFNPAPARFTADGRHVVYLVYPTTAELEQARRAKKKPADQPKSALAILRVADGQVQTVPAVKSFQIAKHSGRYLAYLLDTNGAKPDSASADSAATPGAAAATPGGPARPISTDSAADAGKKKKKEYGAPLVLRDLETGAETRFADVTAFEIDEAGRWLAFTVSSRNAETDGAYVHSLADGRTHTLLGGEGDYKQLAFDEKGTQVAFLSNRDSYAAERPAYALYHAMLRAPAARAVVTAAALPQGWIVSEHGRVSFTRGGGTLLFGTAPAPLDSIPADSLADKAVFDLWHWNDEKLQPQQRIEAQRTPNRSYTTAYQLGAKRVVRLASDSFPNVTVSDDGRVALALSRAPYAVEAMWGEGGDDVYLIDATSGRRTKVAERVEFGATLSPGGRYVLYFRDGRWHAYDVAARRSADLTGALGVKFDRETWSTPSTPAPWGVGGWTEGDRAVLLYDRYDVWEIDPNGKRAARNLTDGAGRRGRVVYRVERLDPEQRFLDASQPLVLSAFDETTKASGFWTDRIGGNELPRQLVMDDVNFGSLQKARDAERYLVTRSTFQDFPNLWTGERLDALARISDANPQQAEYAWGSVELVKWVSGDGIPLEGLLYKPAGFTPSKQYPMVVYFYETHSENLHQYVPPAGRNIVNPSVYTSLGYLVFMPDIAYADGYPGPSAVKSIVPGVHSLIARGFVDPKAIGSAGQSWGGYQTAYMVTQTNLFAAAVANAPVANMTSAYGGIRWASGLARAFQYEKTQSRIGGSLWQYPMRYLENSPLFHADRVETPLLMMHNDNDGAVPWYQGIEMFVALRRLGKEVYLINYNGDEHNPTKRANQKDIDQRMQQFFDHHLRGAPAPEWMRSGIPFVEKGRR
jgi:dipeptidyl aminopeptidase/acylaminoacyl peptidase